MYMKARDALDRNLIAILEQNARISASELARQLGIARSTVNERIARLERDGVILGYSAIIRPADSSASVQSVLSLVCDRALSGQIVNALRALPELRYCYTVSGHYDLVCMCETPQAEDLDSVIEEIARIRGVKSVDSTMILSTKFCRGIDQVAARGAQLSVVV